MRYAIIVIALLFIPVGACFAAGAREAVVHTCQSTDPIYARKDASDEWAGVWPRALDLLFAHIDLPYTLSRESRARCTELAAAAEPGGYEAVVGRVLSTDRLKNFWPIPIFQHFSIIFSAKKQFPDGLPNLKTGRPAQAADDLFGHTQCGFQGWSREYYKKRAGYPDKLDLFLIPETDVKNRFERALELLVRERCDMLEFPVSAMLTIRPDAPVLKQVNCLPLGIGSGDPINILVSRKSPRAEQLALKLYEATTILYSNRTLSKVITEELQQFDMGAYPENILNCAVNGAKPLY